MGTGWKFSTLTLALAGWAALAGCGGPVIRIRHDLPRVVPVPPDIQGARIAQFSVHGGQEELGGYLAAALREKLAGTVWPMATPASQPAAPQVLEVDGEVFLDTHDRQGTRKVRRWDGQSRRLVDEELPSLVRTVRVAVEFHVRRAGGGGELFVVESRRSYNSAVDPRVWGELGLQRPDDPARVPPAEPVARELLAACAEEFAGMVAPVTAEADVPLRPCLLPAGLAGLRAAGKGDFPQAVRHFQEALRAQGGNADLLFDLAVAQEAAGGLAEALANYQAVVEQSRGRDLQARQSAQRVRRVMEETTAASRPTAAE